MPIAIPGKRSGTCWKGELEITIGGETKIAGPGFVGVVPPNVTHSVIARSDGKATVVDTPRRQASRAPDGLPGEQSAAQSDFRSLRPSLAPLLADALMVVGVAPRLYAVPVVAMHYRRGNVRIVRSRCGSVTVNNTTASATILMCFSQPCRRDPSTVGVGRHPYPDALTSQQAMAGLIVAVLADGLQRLPDGGADLLARRFVVDFAEGARERAEIGHLERGLVGRCAQAHGAVELLEAHGAETAP